MLRELQSNVGTLWCSLMHESVMWPVHGEYECRTCGRRYPAFAEAPARWRKANAFKPAASLMLALAAVTVAATARAGGVENPTVKAEAALERYAASGALAPWPVESVEIHAALPKLSKSGRLLAIRRLAPAGDPSYQVIQFTGDGTVKQQVIVRYLNAEARASELAPAMVAIKPANYRFAYKGEINDGETLAYAFQITPRKKREGMIKGELWLDQTTGSLVRESGKLVKSPSIWIKRVAVTQENAWRNGRVESRLTHIFIDTRLVGRAELVIEERPLKAADNVAFTSWNRDGGRQ
jgi:hypothetical protein